MGLPSSAGSRVLTAIVLLALLGLMAAASIRRIWVHDFWWQYATGKLVSEQGPPRTDVFSYTARGAPWIELRWVYCWLLYQGVERLGPALVSLAAFLGPLVAFSLVIVPVIRRPHIAAAGVVMLVAIMAIGQRFVLRPEIVTYLMMAVYLRIIERHRRQGGRAIYALPILQIVWVNSHTLFTIGPGLVGLLLAETLVRCWRSGRRDGRTGAAVWRPAGRVAAVFVLTLAACLVNPHGYRSFPFAFQLLHQIHGTILKDYITEFRSPFYYGASFALVFFYEVLLVIVALSALLNIRRLDPYWTLLTVTMGYLSAVSIRNIPLFCLAGVPFAIRNLQDCPLRQRPGVERYARPLRVVVSACVAAAAGYFAHALATNRFYIREQGATQAGVGMARHADPSHSARPLTTSAIRGHVFGTWSEGAYLIAHGIPAFIDGRLEVYGPDGFARYAKTVSSEAGWRESEKEFDIRAALINLESLLINILWEQPRWRLIGFDEVAAAFVRDDAGIDAPAIRSADEVRAAAEQVRRALPRPRPFEQLGLFEPAASPVPYTRVGVFLMALGYPDLAEPFLVDALRAWPGATEARKYYGQILEGRGDVRGAVVEYERVLRETPDDVDTLLRLANQYMEANRDAEAAPLADRALQLAPEDARAWAIKAGLLFGQGHWERAAECMQKAVDLDPKNPQYPVFLAAIRQRAGSGS